MLGYSRAAQILQLSRARTKSQPHDVGPDMSCVPSTHVREDAVQADSVNNLPSSVVHEVQVVVDNYAIPVPVIVEHIDDPMDNIDIAGFVTIRTTEDDQDLTLVPTGERSDVEVVPQPQTPDHINSDPHQEPAVPIDDTGNVTDPDYEPSDASIVSSIESAPLVESDAGYDDDDDNSNNNNDDVEPHGPRRKKAKKGQSDPDVWHQNNQQLKRQKGEQYEGNEKKDNTVHKVLKRGRQMKPRCNCKPSDSRQCHSFGEDDRVEIFTDFWQNMSWEQRRIYVHSMVDTVEVRRRRGANSTSRRNVTLMYHLKQNGVRKPICKRMFLSTVAIGEWSVKSWAAAPHHAETRQSAYYQRSGDDRQFMRAEFLEKLPKLPSHYCRSSSTKLYLEPNIRSLSDLYGMYKVACEEHTRAPLGRKILKQEVDNLNIGIFHPRKDQCDTCVAHEVGNVTDELWNEHLRKKDAARQEKSNDKILAETCATEGYSGDKILVVCMDLQAVLLAPQMKASALYYKTKLAVHNFTVYNMATHDVICYVWHEGEGGLTANEFASCVHDYLLSNLNYDTFILYSDGCTYQNRNSTMSNMLLHFAKTHKKLVLQKILEKGHTQMEVDSAHSVIERKLKNVNIYCPANYVDAMEKARTHPRPYTVKYVEHRFFKNFSSLNYVLSIRPGRRSGDPTVTDLRAIRYSSEGLQYKLSYADEWKDIPQPRRQRSESDNDLSALYDEKLSIKESKFNHLQQLKVVIPADYHTFYDQLRH